MRIKYASTDLGYFSEVRAPVSPRIIYIQVVSGWLAPFNYIFLLLVLAS